MEFWSRDTDVYFTYISFGIILTQFQVNFSRQEHQINVLKVSFNAWDSQVSAYTPSHFSFTVPFKKIISNNPSTLTQISFPKIKYLNYIKVVNVYINTMKAKFRFKFLSNYKFTSKQREADKQAHVNVYPCWLKAS